MKSLDYETFVASKLANEVPTGIEGATVESPHLFDFQRDLTQWALRRGRAAIFASTGTGKTRVELHWAQRVAEYTGKPVLLLAPIAVGQQTHAEGHAIGIDSTLCRGSEDVQPGVNIANYERLHRFDPSVFGGVVCDESSICKNFNGKTLRALQDAFGDTPFRLLATATPSPNDYTELGTHAELLGVCSRTEMLSEFFVHDGGNTQSWRLKGHARKAFWQFVASWGALVRSPADLGYDASAYELPPLRVHQHVIEADENTAREAGMLFVEPARGLMERRAARRSSIKDRVERCAQLVNDSDEPWIVWCLLNAESDALKAAIPGAVEIRGSNTIEEREERLAAFASGEARVVISKARVTGMGLNWQHCCKQAFVGIDDSWELYHQAVRRSWRFGQTRPVDVHLFCSELEGAVMANLERKEADAQAMAEELSRETCEIVRNEVRGQQRATNLYLAESQIQRPAWA